MVAEGQIGGASEPQNFILDTGSAPSIINARLARELGLATTASTLAAIGSTIVTQSATLPQMQLGPLHVVALRVQVRDLSRVERDFGIPLAGILGLDVLSRSNFRIDYERKRLEFGNVPDDGISVPFDARFGIAVARVKFEGRMLRLLVDTGSDQIALLGGSFAETERLGLRRASQEALSLADHPIPLQVSSAHDLVFGEQHFRVKNAYLIPGAADPDFDGLLGIRALGFRAIAYDQGRGTLYLQR